MSLPIQSDGRQRLLTGAVLTKQVTVTLAELNAGKKLIETEPGFRYKLVSALVIFNGTFTALTDMRLQSSDGTPVVAATVAQAQMANGAKLDQANTNFVLGTGFFAFQNPGVDLEIQKTGADAAGGTSIGVYLAYVLDGPGSPVAQTN